MCKIINGRCLLKRDRIYLKVSLKTPFFKIIDEPLSTMIDNLYLRFEHNSSSSYIHFTIQTHIVTSMEHMYIQKGKKEYDSIFFHNDDAD